jgi:serine protease AprX
MAPQYVPFNRRYKVRFPGADAMQAAQLSQGPVADAGIRVAVMNDKRRYLAVTTPDGRSSFPSSESRLDQQLRFYEREFAGDVVEDYRYELEHFPRPTVPGGGPSLDDVIAMIGADQAWAFGRGAGITIAVVDTGIDGTRPEFPAWKRAGAWQPEGEPPWTDWHGHGTMSACIAAGTRTARGEFDGIAPDARVIACRTHFYDSELAAIYDFLMARAASGERIVVTNAFGIRTAAPPRQRDSDFLPALADAVNAGLVVCFSARNSHHMLGGMSDARNPAPRWLHKCVDRIVTAATCKLDRTMWFYSCRRHDRWTGSADWPPSRDAAASPDNGVVVFGPEVESMFEGWGRSSACPQVAGLAALLWSKTRALDAVQIRRAITSSCASLGRSPEDEGLGLLDCVAAMHAV